MFHTASPLMLLVLLLPMNSAHAQCARATTTQDLISAVESAEAAFADVDLAGFKSSTEALGEVLPCLSETLPRNVVATVHRMYGMRAFVDRDPDRSTQAFAAARAVEPAYRFPEYLVPSGHPILRDYEAIPVDNPPTMEVPPPADGYIYFDGRAGTVRPTAWPTVVQLVGSDGATTQTAYLWPGDAMPPYTPAQGSTIGRPDPLTSSSSGSQPLPTSPASPVQRSNGIGPSVPIAAAAGAAAIASGLLYGMAAGSSAAYHDESTPYTELESLRSQTNGRMAASVSLGVVALGAGAGALVVGQW